MSIERRAQQQYEAYHSRISEPEDDGSQDIQDRHTEEDKFLDNANRLIIEAKKYVKPVEGECEHILTSIRAADRRLPYDLQVLDAAMKGIVLRRSAELLGWPKLPEPESSRLIRKTPILEIDRGGNAHYVER